MERKKQKSEKLFLFSAGGDLLAAGFDRTRRKKSNFTGTFSPAAKTVLLTALFRSEECIMITTDLRFAGCFF